ncbi:hypothetical protein A0H81_10478 [Grifola frondosa]|uniref:Uncharacterized protein n=1 Tax=Grifola frondosa TaxID=5627 RepID=A0A1C7LZ21_GRIFR|nr:hypothetical protein A0H81_10478 [Grifola frondosa]
MTLAVATSYAPLKTFYEHLLVVEHCPLPPSTLAFAVNFRYINAYAKAEEGSSGTFCTVLARQTPADVEYDLDNPLDGLCVARLRAIFKLPEAYGAQFKHPLAFVEWFTPFRTPDPDTDRT